MANILINFTENDPVNLLPVQGNPAPLILNGTYQDVPLLHVLNLQSYTAIGLWFDVTDLVDCEIRLLALPEAQFSGEGYPLPIHLAYSDAVRLQAQKFFLVDGTYKLLVTLPLAVMVNYCKLQMKATSGTINGIIATAKGRF